MRIVFRLPIVVLFAAWVLPVLAGHAHAQDQGKARYEALINQSRSSMLADPVKALGFSRQAVASASAIANERERQLAAVQGHWLEAEALSRTGQVAQSSTVATAALGLIRELDPGSKLEGNLLATTGQIAQAKGDVAAALEDFQRAFTLFERGHEPRSQAKVLQYIGTIYYEAGDYPRMLKYYQDSAELFDDPAIQVSAYNNQGDALIELKRYNEAFALYKKSLALARALESDDLVTSIITNMASAQYQSGNLAGAQRLVAQGLASKGARDPELAGFLWGISAQIAWAGKSVPAASAALDRLFGGADLNQTGNAFMQFHDLASQIYAATGDYPRALAHARAYQRLDQQRRAVMTSTNSALMSAQFDYANQELKVSRIRAKKLESDVALERSRERFNRLAFYGLIGLLVIAVLVVTGLIKALRTIRLSRNEVRRTNVTLQDTNAELQRALEAKTRFLATTSHEIRTPLNGILGMAQVLLSDSSVSGVVRERVKTVYDAGTAMRVLVDDILDVAKMETSGVTVSPEPTRLRPLLAGVVELWKSQAAIRGISVDTDLASCGELVMCDPRLVRQITFNLLSNAVKFTERGRIGIAASTRQGVLRIAVTDTGIGIAHEHLTDIFKSFHQIDNSTQRQFGGTGLGLAISRNLARAMGGDVSVVSEVGKGSTFTFALPLEEAGEASATAQDQPNKQPQDAAASAASAAATTRILLIEASPLARNVIAKAIAGEGVEIIQADGAEAAGRAAGEAIGVILADIASAGGWDGLAAILALPGWSGHKPAVVVLVQGSIDEVASARATELGVALTLSRPLSAANLRAGIATARSASPIMDHESRKVAA